MARINIEDSLFKDPRYSELIIAMGSRHAALGAFVEACILAQEFYLNEETNRMIPITEWKRRKAVGLIIDVGLAEFKGDNNEYVYIVGSEKQFSWLLQRQEAGQKGGRPKTDKTPNQIKEQHTKAEESGRLSEQIGPNPLPLPLPLPLPPTLIQNSNSNNLIIATNDKSKKASKSAIAVVDEKTGNKVSVKISSNLEIQISSDLVSAWSDTYPKEFLELELKNARNWVLSNPHKAPKSAWGRFLNSWFQRGWERYRTTLKSQPTKLTTDDLNEILGAEL